MKQLLLLATTFCLCAALAKSQSQVIKGTLLPQKKQSSYTILPKATVEQNPVAPKQQTEPTYNLTDRSSSILTPGPALEVNPNNSNNQTDNSNRYYPQNYSHPKVSSSQLKGQTMQGAFVSKPNQSFTLVPLAKEVPKPETDSENAAISKTTVTETDAIELTKVPNTTATASNSTATPDSVKISPAINTNVLEPKTKQIIPEVVVSPLKSNSIKPQIITSDMNVRKVKYNPNYNNNSQAINIKKTDNNAVIKRISGNKLQNSNNGNVEVAVSQNANKSVFQGTTSKPVLIEIRPSNGGNGYNIHNSNTPQGQNNNYYTGGNNTNTVKKTKAAVSELTKQTYNNNLSSVNTKLKQKDNSYYNDAGKSNSTSSTDPVTHKSKKSYLLLPQNNNAVAVNQKETDNNNYTKTNNSNNSKNQNGTVYSNGNLRYKFIFNNNSQFSVLITGANFSVTVSQLGKVTDYSISTNIGVPVTRNYRGLIETIDNTPMLYYYDGKLYQIGTTTITYNYNNLIDKVGEIPIVYNYNNSIYSIGNNKINYDENGKGASGTIVSY